MREFDFTTVPIVDIVNEIIVDGATNNASDIHFDPAEKYLKIRMRIDGDLRDYSIIENKYKRNLTTRIKLLSGMNITESRLPQDGAIKTNINGKDLDLRVAVLPTSFGEKVVIRILDYTRSFEGIEALGFTKENYKRIENMLNNPNGIILVTGATGSGKSTTVYSMLQRLNKEDTNIITVEDPVEMNIEGINQVQVNSEIGLDFAAVLRSILREDPNVILIGEIRDSETAKIAVRASITGHLVLSTLHTNNSLTTIERLLDMDVERYLLSTSVKGIISQTLAKRMCQKCKKQRATTDAEKRIFKKVLGQNVNFIYEPGGCPNCRNGYKGRIALQEVLFLNDEIRDAINENINRAELRDMIYKRGTKTLFQDGLLKVIDGITTMEEVFRLVDVDDDFDNVYGKDNEEYEQQIENEETSDELDEVNEEEETNEAIDENINDEEIDENNEIGNNEDNSEEHKNDWFNTPNLTELLNQINKEPDKNDINDNDSEEQHDDLINTTDLTDLLNQINDDSEIQNNDSAIGNIENNDVNLSTDIENDNKQNNLFDETSLNELLNQENDNKTFGRDNIITDTNENNNINFDNLNSDIELSQDDENNNQHDDLLNEITLNELLNQENNDDETLERYNIITDTDKNNWIINNSDISNDIESENKQNNLFDETSLNDLLNQENEDIDENMKRYNITINVENNKLNDNVNISEKDELKNKHDDLINEHSFGDLSNEEYKNDWFNTPNLTELLNQNNNDLNEEELIKSDNNNIEEQTQNKKNEDKNSSNYTDDLINIINQGFFE